VLGSVVAISPALLGPADGWRTRGDRLRLLTRGRWRRIHHGDRLRAVADRGGSLDGPVRRQPASRPAGITPSIDDRGAGGARDTWMAQAQRRPPLPPRGRLPPDSPLSNEQSIINLSEARTWSQRATFINRYAGTGVRWQRMNSSNASAHGASAWADQLVPVAQDSPSTEGLADSSAL